MPLTEKEPGEKVLYPYPVKKVRVQENIELAYIEEGDPSAEVLLFLHGMGSGIPAWEKNISVLKKHFRCIAVDLPGHGLSSKGDYPFTMAFYVEVVFAFMKEAGLAQVTLVGHSMGGQISILAALKEPALITRLILVSPAGIEPYTSVEKQTLITMSAGVVASGNAFTKNRFNYLLGFCNDQELAGELIRKLAFFKEDAANFGKMMLHSIEGMLLEAVNHELTNLTQPCLMLVGKEDKVSPYQYLRGQEFYQIVEREASKIPRAKLVVIPQGGHFVQYQKPKAFNREVLEFLHVKVTV
ncbi:alpha/beta fold hydrolase [Rufibacter immobilis]|uniref:alpha/beta fold hydrolase n=1 Tax=Rufibacter immobilis TaxID=1348778 RepID=UPI0035E82E99